MKKRINAKILFAGIITLMAFVLWTVLVRMIDVKSIGPEGSSVGFAAFNACVHELTGVHFGLYLFIDWVSILPFLLIFGFGLTGLIQWIKPFLISLLDLFDTGWRIW